MKFGWIAGVVAAVLVHAVVLLFGGALFLHDDEDHGSLRQVDLVSTAEEEQEKEQEKPTIEETIDAEELQAEEEEVPDAAEVVRNLELSAAATSTALEAASLGAIEAALSGRGGGDFADSVSFASGGRIGGLARAGALDNSIEQAFSLGDIDQKPRVIYQSVPPYPADMRGRKVEGLVSVIFVVDETGKVTNPRVESSSHKAFERPALDAVKQWKFEPAIKGGQRVACKMRAPIRFQPS